MSFTGTQAKPLHQRLKNDGFFPVISLREFQLLHRIPSHFATEAIEHQLELAKSAINNQMATQKIDWVNAGHETLDAVDSSDSGFRRRDYLAAIFYRAKANLLIDFQTMSRRASADDQAKEGDRTYQQLMSESSKATRRLMGHPTSIGVELL